MKMININKWFMLMALPFAFAACVDDDTALGTGAISEITIDTLQLKRVYNIDKNETLTIPVSVTQAHQDKPLTYAWELDGEIISNESTLTYVGEDLGTFACRLIVSNEDGKAFYPFTLNVNSPYEEGITVLSVDEEGKSMMSFMLTQREEGVADHFDEGDCFVLNNPDYSFANGVADMAQCNGSLILMCKGEGTTNKPGTVYFLNEKTFVMENMVTAPEYPDFKPVSMALPRSVGIGTSFPIVTESGKVYAFSPLEGALTPSAAFPHVYSPVVQVNSRSGGNYDLYLWDEKVGGLCGRINGYGPYYCSYTYLNALQKDEATGEYVLADGTNYFQDKEFVTMFMPEPASSTDTKTLVVITKQPGGSFYYRTILYYAWWQYDYDNAQTVLSDNGGTKMCGIGNTPLTSESAIVSAGKYGAMLFSAGNKVYEWVYNSQQMLTQAGAVTTVGTEAAVITQMSLSPDQTETYVAFYEPQEQGLNGHVWVIATETGEVLRKYDNVCYRPVRMIYKKK